MRDWLKAIAVALPICAAAALLSWLVTPLLEPSPARAQGAAEVQVVPQDVTTLNLSQTITTGLTYQTLVPAASLSTGNFMPARRSLTIQNNNSSDACELIVGTNQITSGTTTTTTNITINGKTVTAAQASIALSAGGSYQRYAPFVPADAIYGTCATTGDSLYIDVQ